MTKPKKTKAPGAAQALLASLTYHRGDASPRTWVTITEDAVPDEAAGRLDELLKRLVEADEITYVLTDAGYAWRPKAGRGRPRSLPAGTRRMMYSVTPAEDAAIRKLLAEMRAK